MTLVERRAAILRCLDLTEELRKIVPTEFAGQLKQPGKIPEPISRYIRELALTKDKYINDPDTVQNLRSLRQTLDDVELGGSIGGNEQEIAKKFRSVQERIGWSITEWREELES